MEGSGPPDPTVEPIGRLTLRAYDRLRENVTEAAKHARNLFLAHLSLNAYGLLTIATLEDKDFFGAGAQIRLPVIDVEVSSSAFFVGMPALSVLVFLYLQVYLDRMWFLVRAAERAATQLGDDTGFVPPARVFHYPWMPFFDSPVARGVFELLSWGAAPTLLLLAGWRVARFDSTIRLWMTDGAPSAVALGVAFLVVSLLGSLAVARQFARANPTWTVRVAPVAAAAVVCSLALLAGRQAAHVSTVDLTNAEISRRPHSEGELPIGAQLLGVRFARAVLRGAYLEQADLRAADLRCADLSKANLHGANLTGSNLGSTNLRGAILTSTNLAGANLTGVDLSWADLSGADLSGFDLRGAKLHGAVLHAANLNATKLQEACLQGTDLRGTHLQGADLRGANLSETSLQGTDLSGADLRAADLRWADLSGSDLQRSDLRGTHLACASLSNATYDSRTRFPAAVNPEGLGLVRVSTVSAAASQHGRASLDLEQAISRTPAEGNRAIG